MAAGGTEMQVGEGGDLAYEQNSRPVGFPVSLRLRGDRLVVETLRRTEEIDLREIAEIRLTYEAGSLFRGVFRTRLRTAAGRTLGFTSVHWATPFRSESRAEAYRAFLGALVQRTARAKPDVRLIAGRAGPVWLLSALAGAAALLGILLVTVRAWLGGAGSLALFGLVLGGIGAVQLWPVIWRNRPQDFAPARLPDALLPDVRQRT